MSKTTVIIGYNGIVNGYRGKREDFMEEWYNFDEGVWNAPVDTANGPYGDEVYVQGKLDSTEEAVAVIESLDRGIDQLMVYAGSLRKADWLLSVIAAVRKKSPDCVLLIFVCDCAQSDPDKIRRLMRQTGTDHTNWYEKDHTLDQPLYQDGPAPNVGSHSMWYYAMVCRRYGQDNMERRMHLHEHRFPDRDGNISDVGRLLGDWILRI